MADKPPAIDPKEQERLKGIFGSSVVQRSNFINRPALPNYVDFMKYLRLNQGKMTYPLAPSPSRNNYPLGNRPDPRRPRIEGKPYRIQYGGVVDYTSPYYDDLPMRHTTPEGRTFTYWEYPQRVARFANMIRSAPPDWQAPDWLNKDAVLEAYDYLKFRNGTGDWTQWKALNDNDPGVGFLQSLNTPPIEFVLPTEAAQAQKVLTPEEIAQKQPVDWDTLPKWMQTYLGVFAPQAEGIYDRPESSKLTASALQSLMIGVGVGAGVSAIATPVAGIIAGLAVSGLLTYQNYTGNQIPGLNEAMIPFNILAEVAESAIGNAMLASVEGLPEVMDDIPSAYRSGLTAYETWKVSNIPNLFAKTAKALGNYSGPVAGADEVWKISQGMLIPQKAPYGKGGEAISRYHEWIESGDALQEFMQLKNAGQIRGRFQDYITQKAYEDYGDTAISNDIVWQTTLDPLNFAPFMIGKAGQFATGKVLKGATDANTIRIATQMQNAFKQGTGNLFIDALPIGVQQLVKGITHIQDSAGLLGTYKIYQGMIRGNYLSSLAKYAPTDINTKVDALVKEGVRPEDIKYLDDTITWKNKDGVEQVYKSKEGSRIEIPEIEELSDFEKLVGGLDEEYGLKELRPTVGEKWYRKLSKLTPAAQVTAIMNTFHQNIASLFDAAQGDPAVMANLMKQMAGQVGINKGDLGESILKSAESRAVQSALKYAMEDGDLVDNIYSSWVAGAERRTMLENISAALDMKPADVLELMKDKPQVMAGRLNKIAPELKTSPEYLTETLKVFMGDDALPWNTEQFQAQLIIKAADKMDDYFKDVYGLKPEPYIFRLSNVFKSVQSLVLLGLNPAYLMNNWVNNVVTRAAEGVGGYMTARQINDFYERMGVFPKDTGLSGYDDITGRVVHEAMEVKDNLGKIQKMLTKVNNKVGVFTRLSGWSEKMEGNQARVAGAKQFLSKEKRVGTGIRPFDPVTEKILERSYPGLKEAVYGAVNAGLNLREIETSIKAQVVTPKIESILDEIGVKYDKTVPGGARELFDKMGLTDRLNDRLKTADTDAKVDAAFDAIAGDVEDYIRNIRDEELKHTAEDTRNKAREERLPFVLQSFGDMTIENTQLWINSRKDWERLYALQANDAITKKQFHNIASSLNEKHIADWNNFNDRQLQTMKGIIEGLGIDNEYTRAFIQRTTDTHALWKDFWQERKKLLKRYFSQGENGKLTWDEVETQLGEMYDATTKKVVAAQAELDGLFARSYKEFTGWDETAAVQWRAELFRMQQELFAEQSAMRERTKGMDQVERDLAYAVFNEKYNAAIAKMKQLEHDGAYSLMNKPAPAMNVEIPEVPNPVVDKMVTDTVKGDLLKRGYTPEQVNELLPDQPEQPLQPVRQPNPVIEKAVEVVRAKITVDDIIAEADATLRKNKIHELGRQTRADIEDGFRQKYKGVTEKQLVVAMELFDKIINRWAIRNGLQPGEAAIDAYYATRLRGIEGGDGDIPNNALEKLDQLMQDPNILRQGDKPKGSYQLMDDGLAVLRGFEASDFSTMVHEMHHVFLKDLPDADIDIVARLAGLSGVDEFRDLMNKFVGGELVEGTPEYANYVRAEESFARGAERYLTEGDAPTPELRSLFRQFTDWMLSIYQALQKAMGRITGFEKTSIGVDIRAQVNGRSLRDIFDNMLTDQPNRPPTFDQLVSDRFSDVKQRGRNAVRFKDQPAELTKMAQRELIGEMFKDFASQDEARAYVEGMTDYHILPDDTRLDDVALWDGLRFIDNNPEMNPWNKTEYKQVMGARSSATGVGDRTVKYPVQFKVIDLDNLIPSDVIQGNNLIPNPDFTIPDIQNRITNAKAGEVSNRMSWVTTESGRLDVEGLLFDSKEAQLGSPIVSSDNMVASGNGRVALLQYAKENYPEKWAEYQRALPKFAADAGIDPESFADMQNPVLVRELDPSVDVVKFAQDTNKPAVAVMTATELALNDANNITPDMLRLLNVLDDEDIYSSLKQQRNNKFISRFMDTLTSNERAGITSDNTLNQAGIERIVNALISKVYNTADGEAMLDTFRNSTDNNIKTLQQAIMASLPQMAYVEGLIQYGMRDAGLSIADDIAFAANKVSSLRDQGMSAGEYLGQMGLFGDGDAASLTPTQVMLLNLFDSRAPKKMRDALRKYANKVDLQPAPGQETVANLIRTKEEILNDAIFGTDQPAQQGDIFGQRPDAGTAETVQGNELARPETTGEVQTIPGTEQGIPGMVEPVQGEIPPAVKQPWEIEGEKSLQEIMGYSPEEAATRAAELRREIETDRKTWEIPLGELLTDVSNQKYRTGIALNEAINFAKDSHKIAVRQALSEGKPVPPEVLADYPDLVAKNVIDSETKADYDAGKPVPIDRASEIDLTHQDTLPIPEDVQTLIDKAESYRMDKKQQARDYVRWILDGEKGERPVVADSIVADYANSIDILRNYAAQKARGVTAEETVKQVWEISPETYGWEVGNVKLGQTERAIRMEINKWQKILDQMLIEEPESTSIEVARGAIAEANTKLELTRNHRAAVEKAISEGKTVPHEVLISYPDLQAKVEGEPIITDRFTGINIQKVFKFKHGDVECVANVYKDGELVAYAPAVPLKDMRLDADTRILGLDPQFPDRIVYEQDGVIKTVDSRKPEAGNGQAQLFQSGQLDMFSQSAADLPLFSGTAMGADDVAFRPKEVAPQMSMFPDIVPEAKPTTIIEIAIKEKGATNYIRLDIKKTKAIRDTLALHEGAEMTARIMDAKGKVIESDLDPRQVVDPSFGKENMLFQEADTTTPEQYRMRINTILGELNKATTDAGMSLSREQLFEIGSFGLDNYRGLTKEEISKFKLDKAIARSYGELWMTLNPRKLHGTTPYREMGQTNPRLPKNLEDWNNPTITGENMTLGQNNIQAQFREWTSTNGNYRLTDLSGEPKEFTGARKHQLQYWEKGKYLYKDFDSYAEARDWAIEHAKKYNPAELHQEAEAQGQTPAQPDNAPIGRVPLNGTPTIEPFAQMLDEVNSDYIRPMMDDIKQSYKERLRNPGFKWGEVAAEHQKLVMDYLKGTVNNDLATVKNQAMKYGQMMRDNALLNYSRRYGADNYLQTVFPYQFWYTRTMLNWAKRMVDKPAWFAMYARMQASREKLEREGMPTRLRGKLRINMPWMPEWMGGGIWVDPMSKIFPFHQFGQPFEQYSNNQVMINRRAESIIEEMREAEKISAVEAENAKTTRAGTVWEKAVAQAELELDKSANPASLVTMMMQPALWWQIPSNIAQGTPEKMSPLPITRTGQTIKELGSDTFLEPMTDAVGGLLAGPETAIRKKARLSEFGQWGDYYVDRMLAGMAAAGEISTDDARIAMIDRQGPAFNTALQRIRTEQSLRTPGALGITALKEGAKPGQVLAATLAGIFGGSLFSEGEMKMRGLKPIYDNAWNKLKAGDESALNDFYDQYPEYSARLALYDKPEERLHQFLIDNTWRAYMDLDSENKRLAREALGDEFMDSFLNKETRSYESIDDKTLAMWTQTLKSGQQMPEAVGDVEGQNIQYYDQPMVQAIEAYKAERKSMFPNYYMWQDAYYSLPAGAERKAFLVQHPQLKKYWEWKDKYAEEHPEIVPYFDELKQKSTGDVVSSELTQPLIRQLYTYATGGSLSAGAKSELDRIRKQIAPELSSEQFIQIALSLVLGGE